MEDTTFGQLKRNEYFTYKGNSTWIKSTFSKEGRPHHNAYRTDYGATSKCQLPVWWKTFNDNDIVQTKEY